MIKTSPDGQTVGGGIHKKMPPSGTPRNYIAVDDINESIENLKAQVASRYMKRQRFRERMVPYWKGS